MHRKVVQELEAHFQVVQELEVHFLAVQELQEAEVVQEFQGAEVVQCRVLLIHWQKEVEVQVEHLESF
jgi:hypothetical protein